MSAQNISHVRTQCCICQSSSLNEFYSRDRVPVYMGATSQSPDLDVFEKQVWLICENCGIVQLRDLLDLELLYQQNHHREIVGNIWRSHHEDLAKFLVESDITSILEFGAGAGYLAELVLGHTPLPYAVVEPDPGRFPEAVIVYKGFAEQHLELLDGVQTLVHSHLLEHLYSPRDFLASISERIAIGKKMVFSIPNFEGLLSEAGSANALNFEHTYYLDPRHLNQILTGLGFKTTREHEFGKHSIFFECVKVSNSFPDDLALARLHNLDLKLISSWEAIESFSHNFLGETQTFDGPRYLFGAHVFSQAILEFLPDGYLDGILDNDKSKQGNRLYGSTLKIFDPSIVASAEGDVVVGVLASHYQSEITGQLRAFGDHVKVVEP